MVRTMDEPHDTVLKLLGIGDSELSDRMQFPTTQRELFDKLQLRLVVFKDKIEVKAVFQCQILKIKSALSRGIKGRILNLDY